MKAMGLSRSLALLVVTTLLAHGDSFAAVERDCSQATDLVLASQLLPRAFPNAPDGYTPQGSECPPSRPTIREASELSQNETLWLETRRNNTISPMSALLGRMNITSFDAVSYIEQHARNVSALPNIAIAASGGGYRAMLHGGGVIKAFDSRETNSTTAGHLGGLLQSSTYVAGLSGGGWLVGSIFVNNFSTISDLQYNNDASSLWELDNSILQGPAQGGLQLLNTADYFSTIANQVSAKAAAGYDTSVTDYWGRALSFQLVNASEGGPEYTWSSIQLQDSFISGQSPAPIVVADGRSPGEMIIPSNATVYEFNPWELGSWDPTTYGFAPLEYIGSNFSGGFLAPNISCVRGFDNVGYIMGTSSSLFNQFVLQVNQTSLSDSAKSFTSTLLNKFSANENDIAPYTPNPFYHYHNDTSPASQSPQLTLVDGGEDLQNIPLHPLIQPNRHIDVVIAIDSSADTPTQWPNGTSIIATYARSVNHLKSGTGNLANGTSFPSIPDVNTFLNLGLNARPTFFGCNASNTSTTTPLIVSLPNAPYVYHSNVSTFQLSFNNSERDAIVLNAYNVATMANATVDPSWPSCLGCAILHRSLLRTGTQIPNACEKCFGIFCWDGTLNTTTPEAYLPPYKLSPVDKESAAAVTFGPVGIGWIVVVTAMVVGVAVW